VTCCFLHLAEDTYLNNSIGICDAFDEYVTNEELRVFLDERGLSLHRAGGYRASFSFSPVRSDISS
jgi:hypothetical protein